MCMILQSTMIRVAQPMFDYTVNYGLSVARVHPVEHPVALASLLLSTPSP